MLAKFPSAFPVEDFEVVSSMLIKPLSSTLAKCHGSSALHQDEGTKCLAPVRCETDWCTRLGCRKAQSEWHSFGCHLRLQRALTTTDGRSAISVVMEGEDMY